MKQPLKKAALFVRDCVEIYVPVLAFCGLFLVFIMQVFSRYVLRDPKAWSMEVTSMCFVWVVMLGACYAQRRRSHVTFTLIYDALSIRWKALTAFLGNLIIFAAMAIAVQPTWEYIQFMKVQKSSVLKVPLNYVYFPYIIFLILMLLYTGIDLVRDFLIFSGLGSPKLREQLLDETKPLYKEAIDEANKEERA